MKPDKYNPETLNQTLAELVLAAQAARDSSRGRISTGYERRSLTGWNKNGARKFMRAWTGTNKRCGLAHLRTNATPAPGDIYFCPKVGGYWVWAVLRGQTVPTWVDP